MTVGVAAAPLSALAAGEVAVVDDLVAHLASAGRPVSLPGLCNAVAFDALGRTGYQGPAANRVFDDVVVVAHGYPDGRGRLDPQTAVPLGAVVSIEAGQLLAYGEVVWKEGAHPSLDAGWVPRWLAGAPALPDGDEVPPADYQPPEGHRVVRERLVLDFGCFGEGIAPEPAKLARLRHRGRCLDRYGHLVIDASYAAGDDEADDVAFWAAWTVRRHPSALEAAGIGTAGDLLAAATSIADALDGRDDVRSFGAHYLHAQVYERLVAEDGRGGRLHHVARGLAHAPGGQHAGWASMSARLADELGEDAVAGTAWPANVVTASLLALDILGEEAPTGDWNGIHLRLDDTWQGGGLWRTERLGAEGPIAAEPAVALGLGWAEHTGAAEVARRPSLHGDAPVDAPDWYRNDPGEGDDADGDWKLVGSEATWLVHVTGADIDTGRLRVPGQISELMRNALQVKGQSQLVVALAHAGEAEQRFWVEPGADGHLDLDWPLGLWPGTAVRCSWSLGATVITASTSLLVEPENVAGITYTHAYNLRVALAAAGVRDDAARPVTLRQLVRAAVARHGEVSEDGRWALHIDAVVVRCFGPSGELAPTFHTQVLRRAVLGAARSLVAAGLADLDAEVIYVEQRSHRAGRQADAALLARYADAIAEQARRQKALHWVPATVVNLPAGWQRSAQKDREWPGVAGTEKLPTGLLAPSQTWRRGHPRGGILPADVAERLERARKALAVLPGTDAAVARLETDPDDLVPDRGAGPGAEPPEQLRTPDNV